MKDIFINTKNIITSNVLFSLRRCYRVIDFLDKLEHDKNKKEVVYTKTIKYCKYCGSNNIIKTTGYYSHYNCLDCKTENID